MKETRRKLGGNMAAAAEAVKDPANQALIRNAEALIKKYIGGGTMEPRQIFREQCGEQTDAEYFLWIEHTMKHVLETINRKLATGDYIDE